MTRLTPTRPPNEDGYILVWVIFLVALFSISLSVAVPRIAKSIQLDRERETMQRGKQYTRAVQLYYRKFHAYPPNADALVKTNDIRFLRKKYVDPITAKDDWKPILFGQNKVPTAMGFFGQPIAGSTIAGTGPSGGNGLNGTQTPGNTGSSFGNSGSSFGSSGSSFGSSGSSFGSSGSSLGGTTPPTTGTTPGTTTGAATTGNGTDPSPSTGLNGQTFGGAGIIGFEPASSKGSILIYKKKAHYNEWEFTYDPLSDMRTIGGGNTGNIGQPASNTTNPVGSNGFGGGSGSSTPITFGPGTSSPTPPQQ